MNRQWRKGFLSYAQPGIERVPQGAGHEAAICPRPQSRASGAAIGRTEARTAGRAATRAATIASAGWRTAAFKAGVRRAAILARDIGKRRGDAVIVRALRKLRRDAGAAVALVEVARTSHIFVIGGESAIVISALTALLVLFGSV
jgi:hypothetical protein